METSVVSMTKEIQGSTSFQKNNAVNNVFLESKGLLFLGFKLQVTTINVLSLCYNTEKSIEKDLEQTFRKTNLWHYPAA